MPRWRRNWGPFFPLGDDRYELQLDDETRQFLARLLSDLGESIDGDGHPDMRRLFPTAYPNDPERDAEYQGLMRGELQGSHRAAAEQAVASLDKEWLDADDLGAWMRTLNAFRLILGTRLGVSEDTDPADGLFIEPGPGDLGPPGVVDTPDAPDRIAYLWMSELLEAAVAAAAHDLR